MRRFFQRRPLDPLVESYLSATAVHGILPDQTRRGMPERAVLEAFLPLISGAVLVGHHIRFDASMPDAMMRRHFGIGLRNRFVDTAQMAMRQL